MKHILKWKYFVVFNDVRFLSQWRKLLWAHMHAIQEWCLLWLCGIQTPNANIIHYSWIALCAYVHVGTTYVLRTHSACVFKLSTSRKGRAGRLMKKKSHHEFMRFFCGSWPCCIVALYVSRTYWCNFFFNPWLCNLIDWLIVHSTFWMVQLFLCRGPFLLDFCFDLFSGVVLRKFIALLIAWSNNDSDSAVIVASLVGRCHDGAGCSCFCVSHCVGVVWSVAWRRHCAMCGLWLLLLAYQLIVSYCICTFLIKLKCRCLWTNLVRTFFALHWIQKCFIAQIKWQHCTKFLCRIFLSDVARTGVARCRIKNIASRH